MIILDNIYRQLVIVIWYCIYMCKGKRLEIPEEDRFLSMPRDEQILKLKALKLREWKQMQHCTCIGIGLTTASRSENLFIYHVV